MPYAEVTKPIPGPEAFGETEDAAILSQAAILLLLGARLRGDDYALSGRARATGLTPMMEAIPRSHLRQFPVPRLKATGERISFEPTQSSLISRFGSRISLSLSHEVKEPIPDFDAEVGVELANRLYEAPDLFKAAQLMELYLYHENELLQVAAATSYFDLSAEPARLLSVLERGTFSDELLVRDMATIALARVAPDHPRLLALTQQASIEAGDEPADTSLLIHGTFARDNQWWQPGGDFHTYLRANVRPDLYNGPDRFEWSGGYSHSARAIGADNLRTWINTKGLINPDIFAHSHGGNLAMLASHQPGLNIGELVLLSCPVHVDRYMPNFNSVQKVVSIRVRLGLVILADRGGQRFRHPNIEENILPIWFDHSATHTQAVWVQHNVAAML